MSEDIATGLADVFAHENPNFDRGKFLEACGKRSTNPQEAV